MIILAKAYALFCAFRWGVTLISQIKYEQDISAAQISVTGLSLIAYYLLCNI